MAVKVVVKESGQTVTGKFVSIEAGKVGLFSGIMSDKKGGFRGCGKKTTFDVALVTWTADDPKTEVKQK